MTRSEQFKTTRGGEGYAEYTVTNLTTGESVFISHPSCGWVVFKNRWEYTDPFETKRHAVEVAQMWLSRMGN